MVPSQILHFVLFWLCAQSPPTALAAPIFNATETSNGTVAALFSPQVTALGVTPPIFVNPQVSAALQVQLLYGDEMIPLGSIYAGLISVLMTMAIVPASDPVDDRAFEALTPGVARIMLYYKHPLLLTNGYLLQALNLIVNQITTAQKFQAFAFHISIHNERIGEGMLHPATRYAASSSAASNSAIARKRTTNPGPVTQLGSSVPLQFNLDFFQPLSILDAANTYYIIANAITTIGQLADQTTISLDRPIAIQDRLNRKIGLHIKPISTDGVANINAQEIILSLWFLTRKFFQDTPMLKCTLSVQRKYQAGQSVVIGEVAVFAY